MLLARSGSAAIGRSSCLGLAPLSTRPPVPQDNHEQISKQPKMVEKDEVERRYVSPLIAYIRDKMLFLYRHNQESPKEKHFFDNNRFPDEMASHNQEAPDLPGGVSHYLSHNYYFQRDGRRLVDPPTVAYDAQTKLIEGETAKGPEEKPTAPPPTQNFNFVGVPTPGFGIQWERNTEDELEHTQRDPRFKRYEHYDRYLRSA